MSKLKTRLGASAALVMAHSVAGAAFAQQTPEQPAQIPAQELTQDEQAEPDRVVVTGSRIRGVAPVGSTITSYGAEELFAQPASNVVEALNRDPMFSGIGNNEAVKRSVGPGVTGINGSRASDINLRGIGPKASLLLFDGLRTPPTGATGRNRDSSIIPSLAIERVDIVADGASAIYGSDAIAGVVNFIPRETYDGLLVRGRVALADGYQSEQLGVMAGYEWDSGGFLVSYEYRHNSPLGGQERDWYKSDLRALGGTDYRNNQCDPGTIVTGGVSYAIPTGGVTPATASSLLPGTENRCEVTQRSDLLPIQETSIYYASLGQDIGDNLRVHLNGIYSRRDYDVLETVVGSRQLLFTLTVPRSNAYFVAPPGTNPSSVTVRHLIDDNGLFRSAGYQDWLQYQGGFEADIGNWNVTGDYTWGEAVSILETRGVLASALTAALASSNPATAYNPFGGGNSQAVLDSIFLDVYDPSAVHTIKQLQLQANGPLFDLPGGPVRMAVGLEKFWLQNYNYNHLGDVRNYQANLQAARLKRDVVSQYVELFVPIVGAQNNVPGIHRLELSAAVRRDDYSDVGATHNPKIGLNWYPVEDLMLRGSYGTSFNAPVLSQTTSPAVGASLIWSTLTDPTAPGGTSTGVIWNDGYPGLRPESATTWSAGVEYKPGSIPGLSASATFFSIDYVDQVNSIDRPTALINASSAPFVTRNPTQAQIDALLATGLRQSGVRPPVISFIVDGRVLNLGGLRLEGIDFNTRYKWDWDANELSVGFDGTYHTKYDYEAVKGSGYRDQLNTIYNPLKLRVRGSLGWRNGPASADVFVNYVNGYDNTLSTPFSKIDAYTTIDARFGYELPLLPDALGDDPFQLSVEVNNIFDTDPNYANIDGGVDLTTASPLGRVVALTIAKSF